MNDKLVLVLGTGRYMIGPYILPENRGVGICVYPNTNDAIGVGQTDDKDMRKSIDELDTVLELEFTNPESLDVWLEMFALAKSNIELIRNRGGK